MKVSSVSGCLLLLWSFYTAFALLSCVEAAPNETTNGEHKEHRKKHSSTTTTSYNTTESSTTTTNNNTNNSTFINNSTSSNEIETHNQPTKRPLSNTGKNDTSITPLIINGEKANRKEYSCFVQGFGCGGVLIWRDIVLTAAHCAGGFRQSALVGAYKTQSSDFGAQRISVVKLIKHPKHDSLTSQWDFSVLKLDRPIPVDDKVIERCKINTNPDTPRPGMSATAIGMGREANGLQSKFLLQTDMSILSDTTCYDNYGSSKFYDQSMLCANGGGTAVQGVCIGDSGSPLFDYRGIVVGLVSKGNAQYCGFPQFPGIFAKVSAASSWINKLICQLSQFPPMDCKKRFNRKKNKRKKKRSGGKNLLRQRSLVTNSIDETERTLFQEEDYMDEVDDSESCENTKDLFDLSEELVGYDCNWLEQQPPQQLQSSANTTTTTTSRDTLCDHLYIAAKCPKTCRVCHIWDKGTGLLNLEDD